MGASLSKHGKLILGKQIVHITDITEIKGNLSYTNDTLLSAWDNAIGDFVDALDWTNEYSDAPLITIKGGKKADWTTMPPEIVNIILAFHNANTIDYWSSLKPHYDRDYRDMMTKMPYPAKTSNPEHMRMVKRYDANINRRRTMKFFEDRLPTDGGLPSKDLRDCCEYHDERGIVLFCGAAGFVPLAQTAVARRSTTMCNWDAHTFGMVMRSAKNAKVFKTKIKKAPVRGKNGKTLLRCGKCGRVGHIASNRNFH